MRGALWWIDRWRQSQAFADMTAEEQGLYRNLCDELWLRPDHVIPDDPRVLAKASGDHEAWARCSAKVLRWMKKTPAGWTNETAAEVIGQSKKRAEKQKRYRERDRPESGNDASNDAGNADVPPFTVHRSQEKEQKQEQEPTTENDLVPLRGTGRLGRGLKALIPATRPAETGPEFEVFAYWRERCGKAKATWTHDRKRVLTRRLAEDPDGVAGLKLAVDGALVDPLHNGSEKGTRYWEFENLFVHGGRNRVEKLQGAATRARGATLSDGSRKTLNAAEAWLARKGAQ